METVQIQVPKMVKAGQTIRVTVEGKNIDVTIPKGVKAGQRMDINVPSTTANSTSGTAAQKLQVLTVPGDGDCLLHSSAAGLGRLHVPDPEIQRLCGRAAVIAAIKQMAESDEDVFRALISELLDDPVVQGNKIYEDLVQSWHMALTDKEANAELRPIPPGLWRWMERKEFYLGDSALMAMKNTAGGFNDLGVSFDVWQQEQGPLYRVFTSGDRTAKHFDLLRRGVHFDLLLHVPESAIGPTDVMRF